MIGASLFIVIFLISTSIALAQNNAPSDEVDNNRQYDDFDWKLIKVLNAKENGNFVVSPLSVKLAIAMVYPALQGAAAKEIEDALNINSTQETVEKKFSLILNKSLEANGESCELNIGTSVFVDDNFKISGLYSRQLKWDFNSRVQTVDFANQDETKAKINEWCSQATKGKIQEFLNGGEFSGDTAMMLLNAIFFRGDWQFPFAENETESELFDVSREKKIPVQMMSLQETSFDYYLMDNAEFIRLPYIGDKFVMYILYPSEVDGLEKMANELGPEILSKLVENSSPQKINLKLPKFKFDSSAELIEVLKMLNITKIFEPDANLELMGSSPNGPLHISKILQKSGIEVNEKGSTAYAATNVGIAFRMETVTYDISITHPFMFLIVDETQKNIIFIGKVIDPSSTPAGDNGGGQQTSPISIPFYIYTLILLKIFL